MIITLAKYVIYSLWTYACKRARRRGDLDYSRQLFNYAISMLFFIMFIILLLVISTLFSTIKIKENFAYIIMCGMLLIIISAHILEHIINYEWIKKIVLTKKEKKFGRLILITLICLIVNIIWIYKN